jgi:DNA replication initiation complex subunit (GINS family)
MPGERVTFESITQVYREEKSKKGLVPLPKDFYRNMRTYISELQKRCDEEDVRAPHSPKSIILHDELKKALKKRDEIWKIRMRKLVTFASSKLMGASIDKKPMTGEEQRIFEDIMKILKGGTDEVCGLVEAKVMEDIVTHMDEEPQEEPERVPQESSPAEVEEETMIEESVPEEPKAKEHSSLKIDGAWSAKEERKTEVEVPQKAKIQDETEKPSGDELAVQILEDLPPLAGKNVNYHLRKDDVVTLPKEIASVLCKKNKARMIEISI